MSERSRKLPEFVEHFEALPDSSRALIRSFGSFYIALPLLGTFTAAFLWEQVASRLAVPYFYFGMYLGLAIGFYVAALCLRFVSLQQLYAIGLVAQALPVLYLCIAPIAGPGSVAIAGLVMGIIGGLYWSTRNLLTLRLTHDKHRDYFFGVDSFLVVSASTIFPILFGCLIEYGFFWGGSIDKRGAFTILMVLLIVILILGARGILSSSLGTIDSPRVTVTRAPRIWWETRLLMILFGAGMGGVSYIPGILVLAYFKGQDHLGGLQSCAALASAFALYRLGRRISTPRHRAVGMLVAVSTLTCATMCLEVGLHGWNVLLFAMVTGLAFPFMWNCINVAILHSTEASDPEGTNGFGYTCDREACIDSGRLIGVMLCIFLAAWWSIDLALTLSPLVSCGFLLLTAGQLWRVTRRIDGR